MGLDYAYEIHLPAQRVHRALEAVVALAPPDQNLSTQVTLPGGERLTVPFAARVVADPADRRRKRLAMDTVLTFEVGDDVIREYLDEPGGERAAIGYIYLTVDFHSPHRPGYAKLTFDAASTAMSRLFEQSASVRRLFVGLAAGAGAICCLLDREDAGYEVCWLDGEPTSRRLNPGWATLDAFAADWPAA